MHRGAFQFPQQLVRERVLRAKTAQNLVHTQPEYLDSGDASCILAGYEAPRYRNRVRSVRRSCSCILLALCLFFSPFQKTQIQSVTDSGIDLFCVNEWLGNFPKSVVYEDCVFHIALSHCTSDLDWLIDDVSTVNCTLKSLTIYSKCNVKPNVPFKYNLQMPFAYAELENVGRCDHTYAHHIAHISYHGQIQPNDVYVFLKDTREIHQPGLRRSLHDIVHMARGPQRFACGIIPRAPTNFKYVDISAWHDTSVLRSFRLKQHTHDIYNATPSGVTFQYPFGNLGAWATLLGIELARNEVVPVCYGGNFASTGSQLLSYSQSFWFKLEKSLTRGDSIEEAHFMERLWAHLLTNSSSITKQEILKHSHGTIRKQYRGLKGTLYACW